jgi:dienelactone hydrolase
MPLLILTILLALQASGAELEPILSKAILQTDVPLVEVQVFTATRVPPMPLVHSAAQWKDEAERLRRKTLDEVVYRGEARKWREEQGRVEWLDTLPGPGYRIRKLRFEAVPGLWIPALLYEPAALSGKVPVVLNLNGHEKDGIAIPYIQERCINLAKRGIIALNPEWLGRGQFEPVKGLVHYRMNQLDLVGTSGLSVFYLSMKRSLDILLAQEHADPNRVAVTGLSGGGWQTITLSALDPRVKLTNPVAGYSSYVTRTQFPILDMGDSEQTPSDLAAVVDYTHLTAMMAPRPTLLTYNALDSCCFRAGNSLSPLVQAAQPIFKLLDAGDKLRYHVNFDDGHNYGRDNREALYKMLRDYFYGGSPGFDISEIASAGEVRTAEQLRVPLPDGNLDFHTLAVQLTASLPRPGPPDRKKLRDLVRAHKYEVSATKIESAAEGGIEITRWRLRMGNDWTVPAVELSPAGARSTVILAADGGRSSAAGEISRRLADGQRVVAIDPFYFGESKLGKRDFLFAMLIAAEGERPLGIQAGQVAAAARWLKARGLGPVTLASEGPRSSVFSLVAAALEPDAVSGLETRGAMSSLREIIDQDMTADKTPELFCFGLLAEFDVPQLQALVAPRPVKKLP